MRDSIQSAEAPMRSAFVLVAYFLFAASVSSCTHCHAQAILYDNTHLDWNRDRTVPGTIWTGPSSPGDFFFAQAFNMGGHDNISRVEIPMARHTNSDAAGTFAIAIWDDNGEGFPGEEVAILGEFKADSLTKFDFGTPSSPNPIIDPPVITLDAPVGDLNPGDTYHVVIDNRGLEGISFDDQLWPLANVTEGTNGVGGSRGGFNKQPPLENSDWVTPPFAHQHLQMKVVADGEPYSVVPCPVGEVYEQAFNGSIGNDGTTNVHLPRGWAFFDDGGERANGPIYNTIITDDFPVGRRLPSSRTSLLNAGIPDDLDRALALGTPRNAGESTIQLVTDVVGGDAKSIQLSFDIEAWDAAASRDNPGEAAFDVVLDLDKGDGFQPILDLGKVTTGATLDPPTEAFVNGNSDDYRTSFDSGLLNLDLTEGSLLRVRWVADLKAETRGWVFGLDNVSLGMFADPVAAILGDFNRDGALATDDLDALSAAIRAGHTELLYDVDGNGQVDARDRIFWIRDASTSHTFVGDSNLDGIVDFADFLALSAGFGTTGGWANGDFDGNGEVSFPDFLALSENFGHATPTNAPVPEPSSLFVLLFGLAAFRRRLDL